MNSEHRRKLESGAVSNDGLEREFAPERAVWRAWLEANGETAPAVWLVYARKGSGRPSITWDEAVEEALCFGRIDSKATPIDAETYEQYFSPRKPTSVWSKVNKARLQRLLAAGLIRPPGLRAIETAKANGSWSLLDDAEALVVPDDLAAFAAVSPFPVRPEGGVTDGERWTWSTAHRSAAWTRRRYRHGTHRTMQRWLISARETAASSASSRRDTRSWARSGSISVRQILKDASRQATPCSRAAMPWRSRRRRAGWPPGCGADRGEE